MTRRGRRPTGHARTLEDLPSLGAPVLQVQRRDARRRVVRAESALPKRPTPTIPVVRNPTRRQTRAATGLIRRSTQQAAAGVRSGAERQERIDAARREVLRDPKQGGYRRAIRHYREAGERQSNEQAGRAVADLIRPGSGRRISRSQAIALSREATAAKVARDGRLKEGRAPARIRALGIDVPVPNIGRLVAAATTLDQGDIGPRQFTRNALSDVVNFPKDSVLAGYELGAAGVELAQGRPGRAKRVAQGMTEGVVGRLARGDLEGAMEVFRQHPVYSGLEVSGTAALAGRAAGAAERLVRGRSLVRAPLDVLPGARLQVERRGSPNVLVEALQRGSDARRQARMGGQVAENTTGGRIAGAVRGEATRGRQALINDAVDEFVSQAEGRRRYGRGEVARDAGRMAPVRRGDTGGGPVARMVAAVDRASAGARRQLGLRGRDEQDLVSLAAEGRLTDPKRFRGDATARRAALRRDLVRERDRLQRVYVEERRSMRPTVREANRRQVALIDRALADEKTLGRVDEIMRAADAYRDASDRLEGELIARRALSPEQAKESKLRTYAISVMGAKPREGGGLVGPDGAPLSVAAIERHVTEHGHRMPAFVAHTMEPSSRAYFVQWARGRKTVDSHRRTGEAARVGGHSTTYQGLVDDLVRRRGQLDAIDTWDRFVSAFGMKGEGRSLMTWKEALREAERYEDAHGVEMVPVRAFPARYSQEAQQAILAGQRPGGTSLSGLTIARMNEATRAPEGKVGARNVLLVPKQALDRLKEHQEKGARGPGKLGQVATGIFKGAVLPFSVKWLFGNVSEAIVRSAFEGVTPVDVWRGHKVMKALRDVDERMWREMDIRARGGLLYGSTARLSVRRGAQDFAGTALEGPAASVAAAMRLPFVRQVAAGVKGYQQAVFGLNRAVERAFQTGVIGKAARRDVLDMTGSWMKAVRMQPAIAREVAKGLTGTSKQVQYARYVDAVLGKYSRFSPGMRRVVQAAAPFLPWYLNSYRYVLYTLPVKHPIKTALVTSMERTFEQDWEDRDVPPGDLEAAIRVGGGGLLPLARFTPAGAFTDLPKGLVDPLLPQASSVIAALNGRSWTGADLNRSSAVGGHTAATSGPDLALQSQIASGTMRKAWAHGSAESVRSGL